MCSQAVGTGVLACWLGELSRTKPLKCAHTSLYKSNVARWRWISNTQFLQLYNHLVVPLDVTAVQQDLTPVHPYQPCTLLSSSRAHAGIIQAPKL